MKFEKGDIGIIEGTIVMDDIECQPTDEIRIAKADNPYKCIFTVQANYYMTGEWIIE
jgi:hypothetical protein